MNEYEIEGRVNARIRDLGGCLTRLYDGEIMSTQAMNNLAEFIDLKKVKDLFHEVRTLLMCNRLNDQDNIHMHLRCGRNSRVELNTFWTTTRYNGLFYISDEFAWQPNRGELTIACTARTDHHPCHLIRDNERIC